MSLFRTSFEVKRPQVGGLCFGCSHRHASLPRCASAATRKGKTANLPGLPPRAANADVAGSFEWGEGSEAEEDVGGSRLGTREDQANNNNRQKNKKKNKKTYYSSKYDKDLTLSLLLPFGEGGLPPRGKVRTLSFSLSFYPFTPSLSLSLLFLTSLSLSLFQQTRFKKEEECDPWTQNCKTESHVWETKCDR